MVTDAVDVPTIGIGAGPHCDGQVLVFHDLLGIEDRIDARSSCAATPTLKADGGRGAVGASPPTCARDGSPRTTRATTWRRRSPRRSASTDTRPPADCSGHGVADRVTGLLCTRPRPTSDPRSVATAPTEQREQHECDQASDHELLPVRLGPLLRFGDQRPDPLRRTVHGVLHRLGGSVLCRGESGRRATARAWSTSRWAWFGHVEPAASRRSSRRDPPGSGRPRRAAPRRRGARSSVRSFADRC